MLIRTVFSLFVLAMLLAGGNGAVDNQTGLWLADTVQSEAIDIRNPSNPESNDDDDDEKTLVFSQVSKPINRIATLDKQLFNTWTPFPAESPRIRAPPQIS